MKYSIVIPTYNHCDDFLKPCVDSILKYSNIEDIEIIISANGCTDSTQDYLHHLKNQYGDKIKVAWSDSALGYAKATNAGIKLAVADKIILLNNDCQLLNQNQNTWLNILEKPFLENQDCGISCIIKNFSKVMNREFAVFFCVMVDKKVFDNIGLLNEEFEVGSGEDMEFCVRTQDFGFKICEVFEKHKLDEKYFTGVFPIYHYGEGTVHDESLVSQWESVFLKNSFKLAKKYNEDWNSMKKYNDKKIGVITPVYNDVEHLFHAISSVKSQTVDNIVHYVYDDASTDGLENAMKEFDGDATIRYIRGDINRGQSFARNELINHAILNECDYIAFLDSDDLWYPEHLENALSLFEQEKIDVVYSKPEYVLKDGSPTKPFNIPVPNIFVGKQLKHNNFIWISSVVARKNCFLNQRFDSSLDSIEDWDMWIRLSDLNYRFYNLDKTTTRYLVRENGQAGVGSTKLPLLKQKHKMLDKLKLHLACGHDYDENYINVDLYAPDDAKCDVRFDVQKLPYEDNSVDEIKAFHIIEHFHFFEIKDVLEEWYRVLKPGGRLYLETPDFLETCRSFVNGNPEMDIERWRVVLYGHFFAHPWVPGQTHKFLFTDSQLRTNLAWAGFKQVNRLPPASKYVMESTKELFLTVEAFK